MGIYKTYKEAVLGGGSVKGVYTDGSYFYTNGSEARFVGIELCNPADYLETLESFLNSGKRLVSGDDVVGIHGTVITIFDVSVQEWNCLSYNNRKRFVLQAAADKVETPKEKEALDAIGTTPQQYESLSCSEKPNRPEWKSGDECIYNERVAVFACYLPLSNDLCVVEFHAPTTECDVAHVNELSQPETPAEREERERLEAAYDLYEEAQQKIGCIGYDDFDLFKKSEIQVKFWLAIVDKTGYRKECKK